jgi:ABC-2 type transport system ATP-binding protein
VAVLRTENLCKHYGPVRALENVSFEVPTGSVFGVLGPNGSGKTTLLGTVTGVLKATSGGFVWFDEPGAANVHRRIGTLLETPNFYPYLTGAQNLAITAAIRGRGHEQIGEILETVGLSTYPKLSFGKFSLGMKQRLAIGATLLGNPELVVLDEPTNGLDPSGIVDIRALINRIHQQGRTILLASHLLDEVEKVTTHVAILKKGRLLESGPMAQLLKEETLIEVGSADLLALKTALESFLPALTLNAREAGFVVSKAPIRADYSAPSSEFTPEHLNRHCFEHGVNLNHLQRKKRNLESRFLELTDA